MSPAQTKLQLPVRGCLSVLPTVSPQALMLHTDSLSPSRHSSLPPFSFSNLPCTGLELLLCLESLSPSSQFMHCLPDAWCPFVGHPSSLHSKHFVVPVLPPPPQSSWDVVAASAPLVCNCPESMAFPCHLRSSSLQSLAHSKGSILN